MHLQKKLVLTVEHCLFSKLVRLHILLSYVEILTPTDFDS